MSKKGGRLLVAATGREKAVDHYPSPSISFDAFSPPPPKKNFELWERRSKTYDDIVHIQILKGWTKHLPV